jgi:hypothetical protein
MNKICLLAILIGVNYSFAQKKEVESSDKMRSYSIKFCPTQITVGEFNFSYEQRVAKRISIELEVGPTISQFGIGFGNQRLWQGSSGIGLFNFKPIDYQAKNGIGFLFSIAPRIYPTGTPYTMKKFYISPQIKYRVYNYNMRDFNEVLDPTKASVDQLTFRFLLGLQFWPKDANFSLDVFWGLGLTSYTIRGKEYEYLLDPNGYTSTPYWNSYRDNGVMFNFTTGLKLGFGN